MISLWNLPWVVGLSIFVGFIIGLLQGDTVQVGGKGNSITVNGETVKKKLGELK